MGDMADAWAGYKEAQKARRRLRYPVRVAEIRALTGKGFHVEALTDWQFRIDGVLDLYPVHRRFHDLQTNTRGNYKDALSIALRLIRTPPERRK